MPKIAYTAAAAKKAKAPKRDMSALLQNIEDMAKGFIPGLAALGTAAVNDVKVLSTGRGNYQLDDIGKAIGKDYKVRYGDAFDGDLDFSDFVEQLRTRPLDFILDAATIATLGGGGVTIAARGVLTGTKGAAQASKLAKLAGYVPRTQAALRAAEKVYGVNSKELRRGAGAGMVRGVRRIPVTVKGVKGGEDLLRPLRENPVLRGRDNVVADGIAAIPGLRNIPGLNRVGGINSAALASVPLLGTNSRVARRDRKIPVLAADTLRHDLLERPSVALRKLSPDEQTAWVFAHQNIDPVRYAAELTAKLDDLDPQEQVVARETIKRVSQPEVRELTNAPSKNLVEALEATRELANEKLGTLLVDLGILSERQLIERRLLPERVMDAKGQRATHHPEATVAAPNARYWKRVAGKMARARERKAVKVDENAERLAKKLEADGVLPAGVFDLAGGVDVAALRALVNDPKYKAAAQKLRAWLDGFYNEARYGTAKPSALAVREAATRKGAAKARRKGYSTKADREPTRYEMERVIKRHGAWSRAAAALARRGGRDMKEQLMWARAALTTPRPVPGGGGLESMLMSKGIHPENPFANLPDIDTAGDVIEEWLNEQTRGAEVSDIAMGADMGIRDMFDEFDAQQMLLEARRLDGDLPRDPDNRDISMALARRYVIDDAEGDDVGKGVWVPGVHDSILRVFVGDHVDGADLDPNVDPRDLPDIDFDPDVELGRIRGSAATLFADRLGIRDPRSGYEPTSRDFVDAMRTLARQAGFDDEYRDAVRALANVEAVRRAKEVAKLRKRATYIRENRTKREQQAVEKAGATVPLKLDGKQSPDGGTYSARELVDPETGRLVRDQDAERPIEELRELAEGAAYFPHLAAAAKGGPGTARVVGAVKGTPTLASNLTHRSTGAAFERGTWSMDPMMLLNEAGKVVRTKLASDLYNAGVARGVVFDKGVYGATGGSKEWVVLDKTKVRGLSRDLRRQEELVDQASALLEGEAFAKTVRDLADVANESDRVVAAAKAGDLVMVPRSYYKALTGDLQQSSRFAEILFDKPLDVFRALTLFLRPAYYVNNVIGQHLILMAKDQGPMLVPQYIRFLATTGRQEAARTVFRKAATDPTRGAALWRDVLQTYAPELRGASVYDSEVRPGVDSVRSRWAMGDSRMKQATAKMLSVPDGVARLGAILSDDLPRQFRFIRLMQPHVKAARADGVTGSDPEVAMKLIEGDPVLRERMIEETLSDLIDYRDMSHFERSVIRRIIPFYGWLRGITVWTADLGYNDPAALYALAQVGRIGERENREWAKQVPGYMAGSVLIGKEKNGKQRVLNTQGLNPFATVGDVGKMLEAALSGDMRESLATSTIAGQLNPFIRASLQQTFNKGRDFTTQLPMGTPWSTLNAEGSEQKVPGGILGGTLLGVAGGLPQPMLYRRRETIQANMDQFGTPGTPSSVNTSPMSDYWWGYAGLPIRTVNLAAARNRRARDEAILTGEAM